MLKSHSKPTNLEIGPSLSTNLQKRQNYHIQSLARQHKFPGAERKTHPRTRISAWLDCGHQHYKETTIQKDTKKNAETDSERLTKTFKKKSRKKFRQTLREAYKMLRNTGRLRKT